MSRTSNRFFVEHYHEIREILKAIILDAEKIDMGMVRIYEQNSEQYLYIDSENKSFASVSYDFNESFRQLCNHYHTARRIKWRSAATANKEQALSLPLYILDTVCHRGDIKADDAKRAAEAAIADGADINYRFGIRFENKKMEGISFLQLAAALNISSMVDFLLEKGSDINYQSADGYTALHLAALKGRKDAVKLLLERGANTTLTNKEGKTAEQLSKNEEIKALFTEVKPKEAANKASAYKPVLSRSEKSSLSKTDRLPSSRSCPQFTVVY